MSDQRRRKPRVILRAAITLDGKLDGTPLETVHETHVESLEPDRARALLVAREIHEIHLTIRPRIDGRRDAPTLSGPVTRDFFPRSLACRLLGMETRDGECLLRYRVLRRPRPETPVG